MNAIKLSDQEVAFLVNALNVAAERYRADARMMLGNQRLSAQFNKQAHDAIVLADRLEDAPEAVS